MFAIRRFTVAALLTLGVLASACSARSSVEAVSDSASADAAILESDSDVAPAEAGIEDASNVESTPTVAPDRSRGQQSTDPSPVAGTTVTDIRDIDFENGFTYLVGFEERVPVTVTDGYGEVGEVGEIDEGAFLAVSVGDITFGDLDDDGSDEAVVTTAWSGGGSGWFSEIHAYRLVDGQAQPVGSMPFGDRADGGIFETSIDENGVVHVWTFSTTQGACCPNQVTEVLVVHATDSLVTAERGPTRTWMSLDSYEEVRPLGFLAGTSSAIVVLPAGETWGTFTFEAGRGQLVEATAITGSAPARVEIVSAARGTVESSAVGDTIAAELPADGGYEVTIVRDGDLAQDGVAQDGAVQGDGATGERTILEIAIDRAATNSRVTWTPLVERTAVDHPEYDVASMLIWPQFASDHPGTAEANTALTAFVTALDDPWIQDVTEYAPGGDSSYDTTYEVTYVGDRLASVRLNYFDYACCRPYPNHGHAAIILDLETGSELAVDEVLDMTRFDDIRQAWIDALLAQRPDLAEAANMLRAGSQSFDSLALVPGGLEFGSDRGSLGGGLPGTVTAVTFAELGDLVQPGFLALL